MALQKDLPALICATHCHPLTTIQLQKRAGWGRWGDVKGPIEQGLLQVHTML